VENVLLSLGIREDDHKELREDFQHLRCWRKSVEQTQSYAVRAVITAVVAGILGAIWMGFKVLIIEK
jgi:hypothetical protein